MPVGDTASIYSHYNKHGTASTHSGGSVVTRGLIGL